VWPAFCCDIITLKEQSLVYILSRMLDGLASVLDMVKKTKIYWNLAPAIQVVSSQY
jgi:hypothetical protein